MIAADKTHLKVSDYDYQWQLIERYDQRLPRYTSYPTVPVWQEVDETQTIAAFAKAKEGPKPLSLYLHIPFCERMCLYCGCNVVISSNVGKMERYVAALEVELAMVHQHIGDKPLIQLHFGGGTPTMLPPALLDRVLTAIFSHFTPRKDAEMGLEIDPVVTRKEHLEVCRQHGLKRLSMGVQDFSDEVQQTVERNQSDQCTTYIYNTARALGFESINLDLMYGLPTQTTDNLIYSVRRVAELGADRLAVFGYAHVPTMKPHQRKLEVFGMPNPRHRWDMACAARKALTEKGFAPIGMDHFALPHDTLALAIKEHRLWRNFQGYTVLEDAELVGVGVSAIGDVGGAYLQNEKRLSAYYDKIEKGQFATAMGCQRDDEDALRRSIINRLMCNLYVDLDEELERIGRSHIDGATYFAQEIKDLKQLGIDRLLSITTEPTDPTEPSGVLGGDTRPHTILKVPELGRPFLRNIVAPFDTYLRRSRENAEAPRYSQSI